MSVFNFYFLNAYNFFWQNIQPTDKDIMRQNSKKKTCENGQKNNGKVTNLSDQKERKQNIENEHTELKVPLNQEETEAGVNIFNIT